MLDFTLLVSKLVWSQALNISGNKQCSSQDEQCQDQDREIKQVCIAVNRTGVTFFHQRYKLPQCVRPVITNC